VGESNRMLRPCVLSAFGFARCREAKARALSLCVWRRSRLSSDKLVVPFAAEGITVCQSLGNLLLRARELALGDIGARAIRSGQAPSRHERSRVHSSLAYPICTIEGTFSGEQSTQGYSSRQSCSRIMHRRSPRQKLQC
jgi:hypothetical protein